MGQIDIYVCMGAWGYGMDWDIYIPTYDDMEIERGASLGLSCLLIDWTLGQCFYCVALSSLRAFIQSHKYLHLQEHFSDYLLLLSALLELCTCTLCCVVYRRRCIFGLPVPPRLELNQSCCDANRLGLWKAMTCLSELTSIQTPLAPSSTQLVQTEVMSCQST